MYQNQIILLQSDGSQVHLHINFTENERNSYRNQTGLREIEINYIVGPTHLSLFFVKRSSYLDHSSKRKVLWLLSYYSSLLPPRLPVTLFTVSTQPCSDWCMLQTIMFVKTAVFLFNLINLNFKLNQYLLFLKVFVGSFESKLSSHSILFTIWGLIGNQVRVYLNS